MSSCDCHVTIIIYPTNLFGQFASLVWFVLYLVVEDREVEGQPQSDGVSWLELGTGKLGSRFVSFLRAFHNFCGVCVRVCVCEGVCV